MSVGLNRDGTGIISLDAFSLDKGSVFLDRVVVEVTGREDAWVAWAGEGGCVLARSCG
ncbi:MAG: hypothetical protein ACREVK_07955 [Gammaproteobacteria bacterium]